MLPRDPLELLVYLAAIFAIGTIGYGWVLVRRLDPLRAVDYDVVKEASAVRSRIGVTFQEIVLASTHLASRKIGALITTSRRDVFGWSTQMLFTCTSGPRLAAR